VAVHTPKRNKGWRPEGTATWQRAEEARQSLLAYMRIRAAQQGCPACLGDGAVQEPTPGGVRMPNGSPVRQWTLLVVCPHCRPEDFAR